MQEGIVGLFVKNYEQIKSVAVYCSFRTLMDSAYEETAIELAKCIAVYDITLVFGNSNVGMTKPLAYTILVASSM